MTQETRFQKVASALRGDRQDEAGTDQDDPPTDPDVTAVTRPDGVTAAGTASDDRAATQPDMFGTTARPDRRESDIPYGNLIPEAAEFRQQWQQIQLKFVDDPRASVTEAADVVAQVTARLEAAIAERQRVIGERQRSLRGRWAEGAGADTETLRETLRMYRAFLDQLLGSR